jgi:N utilization substance protein B
MTSLSTRREARERALLLAYERDVRGISSDELLSGLPVAPDSYTIELVEGIESHLAEIDALLEQYSERWTVDRMPVIDRTLLRLGTLELGWEADVPVAVVVDEAVELAKQYSTEDSPRFVNGLLSRIAKELRPEKA